jgi:hypothetical protein
MRNGKTKYMEVDLVMAKAFKEYTEAQLEQTNVTALVDKKIAGIKYEPGMYATKKEQVRQEIKEALAKYNSKEVAK